MQDADEEDRLSGVDPLEALGLLEGRVDETSHAPDGPEEPVDGNGQAAFKAAVRMAMRVLAQNAGYDSDAGEVLDFPLTGFKFFGS